MAGQVDIHPSAIVDPSATLGTAVQIGPFCVVSGRVSLGDGVRLLNNVTVMDGVSIGAGTSVYPGAVIGAPPQNLKHKGGPTTLSIGSNGTVRESVTIHTGSDSSRGTTTIGDNAYLMAYAHIAHDCTVGNNVTMANCATLGGHVDVGNNVTIGGLTAVHQFVRIGDYAFIGGCAAVVGDVIPFAIASGNRAKLRGLNLVGLRRSGMSRDDIKAIRHAYDVLFDRSNPVSQNIDAARSASAGFPNALKLVDFFAEKGKRIYTVPPVRVSSDADNETDH